MDFYFRIILMAIALVIEFTILYIIRKATQKIIQISKRIKAYVIEREERATILKTPPAKFDESKTSINEWIKDMQYYFNINKITNDQLKQETIVTKLPTVNKRAIQKLLDKNKFTNYKEMTIYIKKLINPPTESTEHYMIKFLNRSQGKNESYIEYYEALEDNLRNAFPDLSDDLINKIVIRRFKNGINNKYVKNKLAVDCNTDESTIIYLALQYHSEITMFEPSIDFIRTEQEPIGTIQKDQVQTGTNQKQKTTTNEEDPTQTQAIQFKVQKYDQVQHAPNSYIKRIYSTIPTQYVYQPQVEICHRYTPRYKNRQPVPRKNVLCYNCNNKGHYKYECSHPLTRVRQNRNYNQNQ